MLWAVEYVQRNAYRLVSVVRDWDNISAMIVNRDVDVVVAISKDHPPADRIPRLEYVEEEEGPAPGSSQRRPRPTDRGH